MNISLFNIIMILRTSIQMCFYHLTVGSKKGQIVQAEQFKFSTHRLKILAIYEIFSYVMLKIRLNNISTFRRI